MNINLSIEDLAHCRRKALARNNNKEINNVTSYKVDNGQSELELHYRGSKGEKSVKKFDMPEYGLILSMDENIYRGGDGGVFDFVTPKGKTIQVKTRKDVKSFDDKYLYFDHYCIDNNRLCVCCKPAKKIRTSNVMLADFAVLVISDDADDSLMTIAGVISRAWFLINAKPIDLGYGKRYGVSQKSLTTISSPLSFWYAIEEVAF